MPVTIPNPSGRTTTAKSLASSPRVSLAKSGPSTPRTPTSEAVIPRYSNDQPIVAVRPDEVDALAELGEGRADGLLRLPHPETVARRRPWAAAACGSVKQKTAARKYRAATTRMTASGLAMLTTSGPSNAKPRANAPLRVRVKMPFADSSCERGTRTGIIASSAGAKKTVTVETKMLSSRMSAKLAPTRYRAT